MEKSIITPYAKQTVAEIFIKELPSTDNKNYVVISFENNKTNLFYVIAVDPKSQNVLEYCSTPIQNPQIVLDRSYEDKVKNDRITSKVAGLYKSIRDMEPIQTGVPIMKPTKINRETFYTCENCETLFGTRLVNTGGLSDGTNFYYRYSDEPFLKKYYSKVDFIGDYMYYLTISTSYNGFTNSSSRFITERVAKYVNYDGYNVNEILNKNAVEKIINDDVELLQRFQNNSKKNDKFKEYLTDYYARKKDN